MIRPMRNSGQDWLGWIPEDWQLIPLGRVFRERKTTVSDADYEPLSVSMGGIVPRLDNVALTDNNDSRKLVRKGDYVINSRSDRKGSGGIAPSDGSVSVISTVLQPVGIEPRYAHHLLRSTAFQEEFYRWGSGIVSDLWSTRYAAMSKITIPVPSVNEQYAIADFLDTETARLDALIEKQRELIALLQERRQTAIQRALTPLADETWPTIPLRYTVRYQEGPGIMAEDFRDEGTPLLRISCVRNAKATLDGCNFLDPEMVAARWARFAVNEGDLLISASASVGTVSQITDPALVGSIPYTGIIRVIPGRMTPDFVRWYFVSPRFLDQINLLRTGTTIQHYGPSHLDRVTVQLPSKNRQVAIAQHLDRETAKVDALIAKAEEHIELAQERRSALISAAVTGQIDITRAVA